MATLPVSPFDVGMCPAPIQDRTSAAVQHVMVSINRVVVVVLDGTNRDYKTFVFVISLRLNTKDP